MRKVVLLGLLVISFFVYGTETVRFACEDQENFPYYLGAGKSFDWNKPGISVEMLKMLEKELDIKVEIVRMPWKRCLLTMEQGGVDGAFNASFKEARLAYGQYPTKLNKPDTDKKITTISYSAYKLKGSPVQWDGKNFKNLEKNIGAPHGFSIVDDLKKMGLKVETSKSTLADMKKLTLGRVSAIAALEFSGDALLAQNPELAKEIEKMEIPIKTKPYYLMLSHQFVNKNPKLAKEIWDAIEKIRIEEYKGIEKKYF